MQASSWEKHILSSQDPFVDLYKEIQKQHTQLPTYTSLNKKLVDAGQFLTFIQSLCVKHGVDFQSVNKQFNIRERALHVGKPCPGLNKC